ncbi:hypothetical protein [Paractinoplanes rishiriensis]|uniref:Uncharacterized protein n=1 Tax=Paractinoplanes rishiriensis TaxID=1050105 RepID=A0A919N2C2_9ACTN|nr:hypothetical protein [Actinoplanes rishiriensis]GIE99367.1 hypothetical protein Ari01nite_68320 [Actinoplanes rishiriensis]
MSFVAHGVGQSQDLPLPLDLVLQAGAATVVISFLGSALLWRRPRLAGGNARLIRVPGWLRYPVLLTSLLLVGVAVIGPRDPSNPAAHALYVWLWVGLIPVSVLAGPVWRAVNPLRTLFRLLRLPSATRRPIPFGAEWPAALTLLAFVWLELVAPGRTDPLVIGLCLIGYAAAQLTLATRYGERWFAQADCFEVYSSLAGRMSPWYWRPPLSGLAADRPGPGRAAFLAVWWGSTIFDSAAGSPFWAGVLQRAGLPVLLDTAALVAVCALVLLAVWRMNITNALIPIAVGYTLAHYLTLLLVEGPRGVLLVFGQPATDWTPAPNPSAVAVLQVALILLGHALSVLAAHDAALAGSPGKPPLAVLPEELPVVLFMVLCTWAGLFLLFVR